MENPKDEKYKLINNKYTNIMQFKMKDKNGCKCRISYRSAVNKNKSSCTQRNLHKNINLQRNLRKNTKEFSHELRVMSALILCLFRYAELDHGSNDSIDNIRPADLQHC